MLPLGPLAGAHQQVASWHLTRESVLSFITCAGVLRAPQSLRHRPGPHRAGCGGSRDQREEFATRKVSQPLPHYSLSMKSLSSGVGWGLGVLGLAPGVPPAQRAGTAWECRHGFPASCMVRALLAASPLLHPTMTNDTSAIAGLFYCAAAAGGASRIGPESSERAAAPGVAKGWGETVVNARSVLRVAGTL